MPDATTLDLEILRMLGEGCPHDFDVPEALPDDGCRPDFVAGHRRRDGRPAALSLFKNHGKGADDGE